MKKNSSKMKEIAETTSAHGFNWLVQSKTRFELGFWSLAILLSLGFFAFVAVMTLVDYFKFPGYTTNLSTEDLADENGNYPLPDFMFCDPYPWNEDKIEALGISTNLTSYISYLISPPSFKKFTNLNKNYPDLLAKLKKDYANLMTKYANDTLALLDDVTFACKERVAYCEHENITYGQKYKCCNFFGPAIYLRGNKCFSTLGRGFPALPGNQDNQLTIVFKIKKIRAMLITKPLGETNAIMAQGYGLKMAIVDKHTAYSKAHKNMVNMNMNTKNELSVTKIHTDNTNAARIYEPSPCTSYKDTKNEEDCTMNLHQKERYLSLGCSSLLLGPAYGNSSYCNPELHVLDKPNSRSFVQKCDKACQNSGFDMHKTSTPTNITKYFQLLFGKSIQGQYDGIIVSIQYKYQYYEKITNTGKSLINVVNGIGGCLGLAVGASLLTLVELLVMVSKLFTSALKEFCSPRTSDNVQKLQY